jgi:protoporphyrinogen oxidase
VRVAVLGAGVAGLVAAHRLAQAGRTVDVYERWPGLGGQAATLDVGAPEPIERYYHHLFTSDRHMAELCAELGVELEWLPSSVAMFARGELHPFTTPLDLLRFRPLPPLARLRMGAAAVGLQRFGRNVAPYDAMTARAWIERWMGRAAWREVWGPLLRAKFGARADDIAMAWLWSKLALRRQMEGDEARRELLGYPRGSFGPIYDRLAARVEAAGGRVLVDRPAARLDHGFELTPGAPGSFRAGHDPSAFAPGEPERYDAVLATVPSDVFGALLSPALAGALGDDYLRRVAGVEYHAALCLLLELDRPFSPYYWTNVADPALPFIGLVEHTNLVAPERYGGRRFLYVANYLERDDPLLALDADELLDRYTDGLRRVNPAFARDWVKGRWLHREPAAQPIVTVGYAGRMPPLRTPVPGLVLANTTQVWPEDRGTNYAVRLGEQAARAILEG